MSVSEKLEEVRQVLVSLENEPTEENVRLFLARGGELAAMVMHSLGKRGSISTSTTVKET